MPQETEISPRSRSAPRPRLPRALLLPGGFPNKVREGKVPVIVQPRFHRVLLPRPRGAGARPLHDRAARLFASGCRFHPCWGPSLQQRAQPGDPPPASLWSGGLRAAPAPAQPAAPPGLSGPAPGAAGGVGVAAHAWLGSGPDPLLQPLESLIPRRSRRRQASSPEARWPGSEGGRAATGVRCAPSELWGRAAVMAVFAECPILGKGRPRRGDPAPAQRAVARAASPCSDRGCYPRSASSGQENHDRPPRFAPAQRSQGSGSGGVTSPWAEPAQWFTAPQTQNPPGEAE